MSHSKIYISGKITGLPIEEARATFKAAEIMLKAQDLEVVNPMELPHNHGGTWREYMIEDIAALLGVRAIYMLNGWQESKGARIEHAIAVEVGLKIFHEC